MALINLILIAVYALIIHRMTPAVPAVEPVKRPRLELSLALGLLALTLVVQLIDFGVWQAQPVYGWVRGFFADIYRGIDTLAIPAPFGEEMFWAVSTTIKQLIPTLLVFLLLGYGRRGMGLAQPHWKLSGVLLGITAAFGLFTGVLLRAPLPEVLVLYGIGIFINALPEELFFRGMLLPRLEKLFANPLNALMISAVLFNLIHVPIELNHGETLIRALLNVFSTAYPSGLIWGYLYLRTRSILPGMLWHAANGNLGFILMNF
jgi:membrane protease YdiL (CAAX protease family)